MEMHTDYCRSSLPSGYLISQPEWGRLTCPPSEGAEHFGLRNCQITRIECDVEKYVYFNIWGSKLVSNLEYFTRVPFTLPGNNYSSDRLVIG